MLMNGWRIYQKMFLVFLLMGKIQPIATKKYEMGVTPWGTEKEFDGLPVDGEWVKIVYFFIVRWQLIWNKVTACQIVWILLVSASISFFFFFFNYLLSYFNLAEVYNFLQQKTHFMRRGTMMTTKIKRGLKWDAGTAGDTATDTRFTVQQGMFL